MEELNPQIILVVAAHADDNEFCFGGSIAKWINNGAEVHYLIVTDGQRGSSGSDSSELVAETRKNEQNAAADLLGVKSVHYLGYEDGRMELSWELKRDIVAAIRKIRPDTVLCMDPQFLYSAEHNYANHNDHRVVGQAVFDAVYPLSRDKNAFAELESLEPHKVQNLLMYNLEKEHYFIDISDTISQKIDALMCHASQTQNAENVSNIMRDFASKCGKKSNIYGLAEGYVRLSLH
jgi:LmbE family N-acetylglucosaminyl deacetylase